MKGQKSCNLIPKYRMYTCISTCEKGIYETHLLEAKWRINYQMLPSDESIVQLKNDRGVKKICISS